MEVRQKELNFQGVLAHLESSLEESHSDNYREWLTQYMSPAPCAACNERRLRPESLAVKIAGLSDRGFHRAPAHAKRAPPWTKFAAAHAAPAKNRRAPALGNRRADRFPSRRRPRLSDARSFSRHDCPAAKRSAFAWRRRSARAFAVFSTSSTSLRSACTRATTAGCSARSKLCATLATPSWSSSTMKKRFAAPNHVVDLGPGAGNAGGYLVAPVLPKKSPRIPLRSQDNIFPAK